MICANSPMLARVHGQCGCASISKVGLSGWCGTTDTDGQLGETKPRRPGVFSYLNKPRPPRAGAAAQSIPRKEFIRIFLPEATTTGADPPLFFNPPPFHRRSRLRTALQTGFAGSSL